jgi:GNAT superfamily N-acetyltransferase
LTVPIPTRPVIERRLAAAGAPYDAFVGDAFVVLSTRTEDLDADAQASIIRVCIEAHANNEFDNLFSYIPSGGRHVIGYRDSELVSHAVATTRWVQPAGQPPLRTAYVDAVSTLPSYQGLGFASAVMRRLADDIDGSYAIGCLETDRPRWLLPPSGLGPVARSLGRTMRRWQPRSDA